MKCPFCSSFKSRVSDSRSFPDYVRRRRMCLECGKRFTTYERAAFPQLYVVKKDGRIEPFDYQKLYRGIKLSFEKRGVSEDKIKEIADFVEQKIRKKMVERIRSRDIGRMVMYRLRKTDLVAFLRFASVHRRFEDLKEFEKVIKQLEKNSKPPK